MGYGRCIHRSETDVSEPQGQFRLFATRRMAPLFITQFFGAFNDNLFKAALSVMFVYGGIVAAESADFAVNAAAGLFVLPFFLFSATAGQIADKYEKSRLIRRIKVFEIAVAVLAGLSLVLQTPLPCWPCCSCSVCSHLLRSLEVLESCRSTCMRPNW